MPRNATVVRVGLGCKHPEFAESGDRGRHVTLREPGPVDDLADGRVGVFEDVDHHHAHRGRKLAKLRRRDGPDGNFGETTRQAVQLDSIHIKNDTSVSMEFAALRATSRRR